jgi:hypothetical protein
VEAIMPPTLPKEAAMKNWTMIILITLGLLVSTAPALRGSQKDAESMIRHAASVIMTPDFSRDAILDALVEVLDASLLILPRTDYAEEFESRIEGARKTFVDRLLFSDKAHQYLGLAYRLVTGGKSWQIPEELASPYRGKDSLEQAKKVCQKLLDSALAERQAGRNEESVRYLLEFVLMVITPVQA